jgi:hypothetical protein
MAMEHFYIVAIAQRVSEASWREPLAEAAEVLTSMVKSRGDSANYAASLRASDCW